MSWMTLICWLPFVETSELICGYPEILEYKCFYGKKFARYEYAWGVVGDCYEPYEDRT